MRIRFLPALAALLVATPALAATPGTSTGQVSISQVMEMLEGAETDEFKRLVLTAYLAGLGETAGLMIGNAVRYGAEITCRSAVSLDVDSVRRVLQEAASEAAWSETPATPILVSDLMERAGCR